MTSYFCGEADVTFHKTKFFPEQYFVKLRYAHVCYAHVCNVADAFLQKDPYSYVNNDMMISGLTAVLESPITLETETDSSANICIISHRNYLNLLNFRNYLIAH